jgi:hypothetical protein
MSLTRRAPSQNRGRPPETGASLVRIVHLDDRSKAFTAVNFSA